jgi:gliding motility-associated-like protein
MNIKPAPAVSVTADTTIKQGNTVQLNASATGVINTYEWSPATDLSDQYLRNPTTRPVNTITYQVTATATDGCTGYGKVTITVLKKIVLPNAFTPNGDGKNDVFRIPAGISFNLKTFSIFDRWGNMVFQTNDITQGWNGAFNGQPANAGTYVYMITGSSQNENVALKGTLELIR